MSTISMMEISYGFQLNDRARKRYGDSFAALARCINRVAFREEHATRAGEARAALRKAGTPIGAYDLLIASTALVGNLVLVTSNTREFRQVPGLTLEDWR